MALAKIDGLDVTPDNESSSRSCSSVPPWTIERRRKSSQTLWPASCNSCSGFMLRSLLGLEQGLGAGDDVLRREAELPEEAIGRRRRAEMVERHGVVRVP